MFIHLKNCWKDVYQNINSYPQWVSLVAQTVKNLPAMQETQVSSWVRKISWRREWLPTPVFLPGEFHGQKSLAGYSSWSCKELDTIEQLTLSLSSSMVEICAFMYFLAFLLYYYFLCSFIFEIMSCNSASYKKRERRKRRSKRKSRSEFIIHDNNLINLISSSAPKENNLHQSGHSFSKLLLTSLLILLLLLAISFLIAFICKYPDGSIRNVCLT